jgi:hypothetical protein
MDCVGSALHQIHNDCQKSFYCNYRTKRGQKVELQKNRFILCGFVRTKFRILYLLLRHKHHSIR